jgi:LysM repeat protein
VPTNLTNPDNTSCLPSTTTSFVPSATESVAANGTLAHTVVAGDTLTTLAQKFNTGICNIAKASGLADVNKLEVGQVLQVPVNQKADNTSCLPASSTGAAKGPAAPTAASSTAKGPAKATKAARARVAWEA